MKGHSLPGIAIVALFVIVGCRSNISSTNETAQHEQISRSESHGSDAKLNETELRLRQYCKFNNIEFKPLSVGTPLKDFTALLGKPTERYKVQNGTIVKNPKGDYEEWVEWYHNPRGMHVAPFIRSRIEKGTVIELQANRR